MRTKTVWAAAAAMVASLAVGTAQEARVQDPAEAFGALPDMAMPALAPDGRAVAFARNVGDDTYLSILDFTTGEQAAVGLGSARPTDIVWGSDDRVIASVQDTQDVDGLAGRNTYLFNRFVSASRDGQDISRLMSRGGFDNSSYGGRLLSGLPDDPDHALVQYGPNVYRAHLRSGGVKVEERGIQRRGLAKAEVELSRTDWDLGPGPDGPRVAVRTTHADGKDAYVTAYKAPGARRFKDVLSQKVADGFRPGRVPLGATADAIVLDDNRGATDALIALTPQGESRTLLAPEGVDAGYAIRDPYTGAVIGGGYADDHDTRVWFDEEMAGVQAALRGSFAGQHARIVSWSRDRNRVLVRLEPEGGVPRTLLFDREAGAAQLLGHDYETLAGVPLGRTERFDAAAPDGRTIPGYLTLPPGADRSGLPLVVLPHGGPQARDTAEFDWLTQYLATSGYAVYRPNFRGSTGYGRAWEMAGYGEWGGAMQRDIEAGARAVLASGIVDPGRACIVGASFGGYAALAAAYMSPDDFACAASINGVADIGAQFAWFTGNDRRGQAAEVLRVSMGNMVSDRRRLAAASPAKNAERFAVPVLLVHAEDDTTVPASQSRRMAARLERAGKPVTYVEVPGGDHGLRTRATRVATLRALDGFLATHLRAE